MYDLITLCSFLIESTVNTIKSSELNSTLYVIMMLVGIFLVIKFNKYMDKRNKRKGYDRGSGGYTFTIDDKTEISAKDIDIQNMWRIVKGMEGRAFEIFVAKLFSNMGYKTHLTQATNDRGIDVVIDKYRDDKKAYIECKRYNNTIGNEIVLKLAGACVRDDVEMGIICTTSSFTKSALNDLKDFCKCKSLKMEFIDDVLLKKYMREYADADLYNYVLHAER